MRYLLVGNYGVGNAGDEILREYFLTRFGEVEWHVCSAHPKKEELPRFPGGVRSLLSLKWLRTFKVLFRADGMVFGGGSLFTDTESVHACFIWWVHAAFAVLLGKPIFLAFQGIGPFRTWLGEWFARFVVRRATFISVRDTATTARLLGMSLSGGEAASEEMWKKNTEIVQTFDPSFLLLQTIKRSKRTNNVFVFIPRFSTQWNATTTKKMQLMLEQIQAQGKSIRILSMQPGDKKEQERCERFAAPLGLSVEGVPTLHDTVSRLEGAYCVCTQRYHGIIAALSCGIPFIALRYFLEDKMDAIASMCGCPAETPNSLEAQTVLHTDWDGMQKRVSSLCSQYELLVSQGEDVLREAFSPNS